MSEKMVEKIEEEMWVTIVEHDTVSKFLVLFTYYLLGEWEEHDV
jgi:hypothetical protein